MAIVKIIAIRDRLDKRVNYAINGEKTTLDAGITYAVNSEKTKQHFFASAINCESCETAYAEMQETKRCFGKAGGVVGYHFIQSFAPGEVTPEQAHRIGMAFAEKLFGGQYEAVIGTHLDKAHLHNHIVVNSVSFVDGRKYHSSPGSYYFDVRDASDALCRENGLSVIAPQGKGKHYAEWKAENTGKPTIRSIIRADIDRVIENAYTFDTFLMLLRRLGYVVQNQPNRKYVTVLPPGGKRAIRLDSLGDGYTEQDIRTRLAAQREGAVPPQSVKAGVTESRASTQPCRNERSQAFRLFIFDICICCEGHEKRPASSVSLFPCGRRSFSWNGTSGSFSTCGQIISPRRRNWPTVPANWSARLKQASYSENHSIRKGGEQRMRKAKRGAALRLTGRLPPCGRNAGN